MKLSKVQTDRIAELRIDHGEHLLPRAMAADCKHPKSPLHKLYDWDEKNVHEKYLVERSREIIRYITVLTIQRDMKIRTVAYVHDPELPPGEQGYIGLTSKQMTQKKALLTLVDEVARVKSAVARARIIASTLDIRYPGLVDRLEKMLRDAVALEKELEDA